jgi:hypothetical protein
VTASLAALASFVAALDRAGVHFFVGGAVASSTHGLMRSTEDLDIAAELEAAQVDPLVKELQSEFDVDDEAVRDAVKRRRPCNIYFRAEFTRIDLYVLANTPFNRSQMSRRVVLDIPGIARRVPLASPEDVVLKKLDWYRQGHEVSQRQWKDVLGVLVVQGPRLDAAYLKAWAHELDVEGLLDRALAEASLPLPR